MAQAMPLVQRPLLPETVGTLGCLGLETTFTSAFATRTLHDLPWVLGYLYPVTSPSPVPHVFLVQLKPKIVSKTGNNDGVAAGSVTFEQVMNLEATNNIKVGNSAIQVEAEQRD
ncbi:hypothetical protein Tco_0614474 [Tanacetum coccineum]